MFFFKSVSTVIIHVLVSLVLIISSFQILILLVIFDWIVTVIEHFSRFFWIDFYLYFESDHQQVTCGSAWSFMFILVSDSFRRTFAETSQPPTEVDSCHNIICNIPVLRGLHIELLRLGYFAISTCQFKIDQFSGCLVLVLCLTLLSLTFVT